MTQIHRRNPAKAVPAVERPLEAPQPAVTATITTTRKRGAKLPDTAEVDPRVKAFFARKVKP